MPTLTVEVMDARRERPAAADRRIRDAAGRRAGAGAWPGRRQRLPAQAFPASSSSRTAPSWSMAGMMTGQPGIFAGGDMVPAERTVTVAVGHGKKAARHIDAWLRGASYEAGASIRSSTSTMLNLPVFSDADRRSASCHRRAESGFDEVLAGLSEAEALHEARRCLSCGNCFECDNCYAACPEDAIVKLGPGRATASTTTICTGCARCFEQCPCHAIEMVPSRRSRRAAMRMSGEQP